jgi:hypothetical protein
MVYLHALKVQLHIRLIKDRGFILIVTTRLPVKQSDTVSDTNRVRLFSHVGICDLHIICNL